MKRNRRLFNFITFFLLTGLLVTGCGSQKSNEPFTYRTGSAIKEEEETEAEDTATEDDIYIIKSVDMEEETMVMYNVSTDHLYRYAYSLATQFLDKYGDMESNYNFGPGTVVEIGPKLESHALSYIQESDQVWEWTDVSDFKFGQNRVTIGDDTYKVDEKTVFASGWELTSVFNITENDVLDVTGLDNRVLSVKVTTGHGTLELINTELFKDSLVMIGSETAAKIYEGELISLPEGSYDVTVANKGYGGTMQVDIYRGLTTTLDLNLLKGEGPKYCELTFTSNVPSALLYLDGSQVAFGTTMTVKYGSHSLSVVADGYDSWTKTLYVNSATATIQIELDEEDASTSSSTADSTTTDTSSSTDTTTTTTDSSDSSDNSDYDVDYLTTLSNMISTIMGD